MTVPQSQNAPHPVRVHVPAALTGRDRVTTAFRILLAIPHLILVGGPMALGFSCAWAADSGTRFDWGGAGGMLGAVAVVCALIAWFAIVFTGVHPEGLWRLAAFYLRWRVRAVAYVSLLRDEYPPFGDARYPAELDIDPAPRTRNKVTVALRPILVLPHLLALWALGMAWAVSTGVGWFWIVCTGRFPPALFEFGLGVFRWGTRVEAYALLLHDEYPPFSLE